MVRPKQGIALPAPSRSGLIEGAMKTGSIQIWPGGGCAISLRGAVAAASTVLRRSCELVGTALVMAVTLVLVAIVAAAMRRRPLDYD
jgi:hypothetical protein